MRKPWTKAETELLAEKYPYLPREEILELFPERSWSAIVKHASEHGIKRVFGKFHIGGKVQ